MARIPIAEIPNLRAGIPQAQMINSPGGKVSLMGIAGDLQQRQMPLYAFSGEGEGWQALGEAGAKVGAVLEDFNMKRLEAQNLISLAQADNLMRDEYAKHQAEIATLPETEWVPKWKERIPQIQAKMKEFGFSPEAAQRAELEFSRFSGRASVELATNATKQTLERGKGAIMNQMEQAELEGNPEKFFALNEKLTKDGFQTPEEGEKNAIGMEFRERIRSIQSMPPNARIKYLESEDVNLAPEKVGALLDEAKRDNHNLVVEKYETLLNEVSEGTMKLDDAIKEADEWDLPAKLKESITQKGKLIFDASPEGWTKAREFYDKTLDLVTKYGADETVNRDKEYEILQHIESLPDGYKSEARKLFDDATAFKGSSVKMLEKDGIERLDVHYRAGAFALTGQEKRGMKEHEIKSIELQTKHALQRKFREYIKKTPDASQTDVEAWFAKQFGDDDVKSKSFFSTLDPSFSVTVLNKLMPKPQKQTSADESDNVIDGLEGPLPK